jgi:CPA1 family monovalent cation:H+ antiporter
MMEHVDSLTLGLLLFVACLVAMISRKIGLPYAVGLVTAGVGLSLSGFHSGLQLTPELVFTVLLPPLIFEAALHLDARQFWRESPLVGSLALVGTLLSAGVVAVGMHELVGWSWAAAALFGSLIAATDPVSVIAMMKEQKADQRLRFLMESESLLNDGAAAVLFSVCIAAVGGGSLGFGGIATSFLWTVAGGVFCGLAVAGGLLLVAGRSDDHLVELTLTVLAAYGSFLLAEELKVSGVLATLAAGMLVGNWGPGRSLTQHGGESMIRFWDFAAFLANSVIFILIGTGEGEMSLRAYALPAAAGIALALLGRAIAIYPASTLFRRSRLRITAMTQHLLFWGGVRGALALALALAIPTTLPERPAIITVAFAVVAFSIFVQAISFPVLLRRSEAGSNDQAGRAEPRH